VPFVASASKELNRALAPTASSTYPAAPAAPAMVCTVAVAISIRRSVSLLLSP